MEVSTPFHTLGIVMWIRAVALSRKHFGTALEISAEVLQEATTDWMSQSLLECNRTIVYNTQYLLMDKAVPNLFLFIVLFFIQNLPSL